MCLSRNTSLKLIKYETASPHTCKVLLVVIGTRSLELNVGVLIAAMVLFGFIVFLQDHDYWRKTNDTFRLNDFRFNLFRFRNLPEHSLEYHKGTGLLAWVEILGGVRLIKAIYFGHKKFGLCTYYIYLPICRSKVCFFLIWTPHLLLIARSCTPPAVYHGLKID